MFMQAARRPRAYAPRQWAVPRVGFSIFKKPFFNNEEPVSDGLAGRK